MTQAATPSDAAAFAMLIVDVTPSRADQVVGRPAVGSAPPSGTPVWVVRRHERPLRARVTQSGTLADGRVRLTLVGWGDALLAPGHGVATDPALLAPWPALPPELAADRYGDYPGPPVPYTWGEWHGVDGDIVVELGRPPAEKERAALERVLRAWGVDGGAHGLGVGYLHGFYEDEQVGRRWSGTTLRCRMDFGSADAEAAADELAHRLAGWSAVWAVPVARLQFGNDP